MNQPVNQSKGDSDFAVLLNKKTFNKGIQNSFIITIFFKKIKSLLRREHTAFHFSDLLN